MKTKAPEPSQIELSLLGPGVGESVVVHLGLGDWMVVDSCRNRCGQPAALAYLEQLGVDVAQQVRLVAVTHWHDDHIRGIARLLRQCTSAEFVCSAALKDEHFMTLIRAANTEVKLVQHMNGLAEWEEVLEILRDRDQAPRWASEGMVIFRRDKNDSVVVHALSPSPATLTVAHQKLGALVPAVGDLVGRLGYQSPNDLSLVLLIEVPGVHLLLGGDLETGTSGSSGWHGVVASRVRPDVRGIALKVPHHGSETADLEGIWTELLVEHPWSVVAPYGRGPRPLPSQADVARLRSKSRAVYCTVWPPSSRPATRQSAVERTIREITRVRRTTRREPGHIRLRAQRTGSVEVELFDGATALA